MVASHRRGHSSGWSCVSDVAKLRVGWEMRQARSVVRSAVVNASHSVGANASVGDAPGAPANLLSRT